MEKNLDVLILILYTPQSVVNLHSLYNNKKNN